MAESSGFFSSVEDDRTYTAAFLANWVASIVGNGVYDGDLAVTADGSGMNITLPAGKAWINGYYYRNDGDLSFAVANADGVLNRIDTVVLRWDINNRTITAQVLQGTPASTAVAPEITRSTEQYDLKLAEISIPAGTTAITQSLITDTRLDKDVCGLVTGVIDQVDTTKLYQQIQADLVQFKSGSEGDFSAWSDTQKQSFQTWFDGIKNVLGTDEATNLLSMIQTHEADTNNPHQVTAAQTGALPGATLTCTTTGTVHALTGLSVASGLVSCVFQSDADFTEGDTFTIDGTAVTAQLQNGDSLSDEFFKSGAVVPFVYDISGAKLNFKSGGTSTPSIFGDGSDGDVVISSNTALPVTVPHQSIVEKNYKSLTIESGATLSCDSWNAGMILRVKGDCTIHGIIDQSGKAPKTNPNNNYAYPSQLVCGNGGSGGIGGQSGYGLNGGRGGTYMLKRSYGGGYGGGGAGGSYFDSDAGGTGGAGGASTGSTVDVGTIFVGGASGGNGSYGGGGGGGFGTYSSSANGIGGNGAGTAGGDGGGNRGTTGGGGGAGNYGGSVILLYVGGNLIIDGSVKCNGLNGGNGGAGGGNAAYTGGGGGGGAGGGGAIYICHKGTYTNEGLLQVNGGSGGSAGSSGGLGSSGSTGSAGGIGSITALSYDDLEV